MKNIVTLALNDLRLFLRDRSSYVWLIVMPLAFVLVSGGMNSGQPGSPANERPAVLIENADAGFLGRAFLEELGAQGLNVVPPDRKSEAKRGVRIPADFTEKLLAKKRVDVEYFKIDGADEAAAAIIELRVLRTLLAINADLISATANGASLTEDAFNTIRKHPNPVSIDATFAGRKPIPSGYGFSLPGMLVMYLMMNLLIFGGTRVAHERELGVLRRITAHPVRPMQVVFGKILGLVLLALVPIAILLLIGQVLLHVDMLDRMHWIVLTLVLLSWVAASLGVLIGCVVKAHEKIIGLCLLVALPSAALGGCWWPLEIVGKGMRIAGHFSPTAWAMDALHQFITFGGGIAAAAPALGMLALFGLAANLAAMKFFRV